MRKKRKSLTAIHELDYEYGGECYNYVDDRPVKHRDTIKEVDVMPYAQHKEDKHFTFLPHSIKNYLTIIIGFIL